MTSAAGGETPDNKAIVMPEQQTFMATGVLNNAESSDAITSAPLETPQPDNQVTAFESVETSERATRAQHLGHTALRAVSFPPRLAWHSLRGAGRSIKSLYQEHQESDSRRKSAALILGIAATRAADFGRASIFLVPKAADAVFNSSHSPALTGLAGGAVFGAWILGTGLPLTEGFAKYPKTVRTFKENFPVVHKVLSKTLPGQHEKRSDEEVAKASKLRNALALLSRNAIRGTYVVLNGHIYHQYSDALHQSENVNSEDVEVREKTRRHLRGYAGKLALDGFVMCGILIGGVSAELKHEAETGHPLRALHREHFLTSSRHLLIAAVGLMGLTVAMNSANKAIEARKERKQNSVEATALQP